MSDKNIILFEIDRMKFREASSNVETIHDKHCNARLDIKLTAHRNTLCIQKRISYN